MGTDERERRGIVKGGLIARPVFLATASVVSSQETLCGLISSYCV